MVDIHSTTHRMSPAAMLVSDHNAGAGRYPPKMYERCWSYDGVYERSDGVMGDAGRSDGVMGDDGRSVGVMGDDRSDGVKDGFGRSDDVMGDSGRRDGVMGDDMRIAYSWRRHDYVMAIEGGCVGESGDGEIGDAGTGNEDVINEEVQVSSAPHKKGIYKHC